MTSKLEPEARIRAFIRDYYDVWERLYEHVCETNDFDGWNAAIDVLEEQHYAPNVICTERYSLGSPPAHHPDEEQILTVDSDEDRALILTKSGDYRFFDYELVLTDGEWRIANVAQTATDPREPLVTAEELAAHLDAATPDAAFDETAENEDPSNNLFEEGRVITSDHGDEDVLRVYGVGELNVVSGVLAVQDFGYDAWGLSPLARRVPPGRYPVEVSVVFGRNAALRVLLGDPEAVVSWHPASTANGGHVAGVDAGNLAVFDVASFGTLNVRNKERIFQGIWGPTERRPAASMLTLAHPNDGVVADSGWGDGAYPCHWGVDAAGEPVVLLLDFLVACSWHQHDVVVELHEQDFGVEPIGSEALAEEGMTLTAIRDDADGVTIDITTVDGHPRFTLFNQDGDELTASDRMAWESSGGRGRWFVPAEVVAELPWKLHLHIGEGYRNS